MCNRSTFEKDLLKGKIGEQVFMNWCDKNDHKYIDVREDKEYQAIDVDFVMGNKQFKLDVKYNEGMLGCGAIVIEDLSSTRYKNDGWWRKASNWFSFVAPLQKSDGYIIITLHRNWIKEYMKRYNLNESNRRQIGNGYGWYIKVNNNNKYNRDKMSIVEYIYSEYDHLLNINKLVQYVDAEGNLIECFKEV